MLLNKANLRELLQEMWDTASDEGSADAMDTIQDVMEEVEVTFEDVQF